MDRQIHFISGLPRSGSTLLCNILAQNPDIHTTPTSACHDSLFIMRNKWHEWIEHKAAKSLSNDKNLQRVLNAILNNYHDTDRPIVIDKGRGWTSMIEVAEFALGREAKILVPVRNINQILASFEKLYREQMATHRDRGDYMTSQTTEGRAQVALADEGPLGLAYNRIRDCIQRGYGDRLHFIEFDDLTHEPEDTLRKVYNFLELDDYKHDFKNVLQYTEEDDTVHGLNLHKIRKEVKPVKDDSSVILGAEFCKRNSGAEFWRN